MLTSPAFAQRTDDNAVSSAEDAFGKSVGDEQIGLYNPGLVRGFSPEAAGNLRIEGLYFDQRGSLTDRLLDGAGDRHPPTVKARPGLAREVDTREVEAQETHPWVRSRSLRAPAVEHSDFLLRLRQLSKLEANDHVAGDADWFADELVRRGEHIPHLQWLGELRRRRERRPRILRTRDDADAGWTA